MEYKDLFKNGSLKFVRTFVSKIVYDGLNVPMTTTNEAVVIALSAIIVLFILYKLAWLVGNTLKFILNCLEW